MTLARPAPAFKLHGCLTPAAERSGRRWDASFGVSGEAL